MKPECEAAVEDALGRPLKRGEAQKLEDAVSLQIRLLSRKDPEAWSRLSPFDRVTQAAQAAVENMTADLRLKQQRVRLQIAAHDRIESTLNDAFEALPDNAKPGSMLRVVSQVLAFDTKAKGMQSVESWGKAITHEAMGRLFPLWNAVKGFAGVFENQKGINDLAHELFGESSGNGAAQAGADAWRQVTDELRDRANAAGMDIGKLDEWHYPQSHSQDRIARAGLDKWLTDIFGKLDRNKYLNDDGTRMSDERLEHFLTHAFDSIITDGLNKSEPGARGYGLTSSRQGSHRQIFFKDADSWLNYQADYGDRNLYSVLTGHIRSISRDIALNEVLGPDAEKSFRYFNDRTRLDEMRESPQAKGKIDKAYKLNESIYDMVSGRDQVVNQKVADLGQSFRNWEVATKLGKVALTALGDEAGMAATAFANRIPWSQIFMRELKYLNPLSGKDRDTAAHSGLGINGLIGGLNRFGTEDFNLSSGAGSLAGAREFTSKLATGVMHASGAEAMWDARRRSLGSVLMSYLGKWTRDVGSVSDLNWHDHGILTTKGVTENDWQVWRAAQPEDWGMRHGVLTPKAVMAVPDEAISHLGDPEGLRRHASTMLLGHVLEETGLGVMDTGAREQARMRFGTQAGTVWGELARSAMLFKGFGASMMMKHWARASMMAGNGRAMYIARLITAGTIMAAVANQLRNLASGKQPANVLDARFMGEAMLRGGGFGFYGDFLYSEATSHDTTLIPALMGPLATEAESAWQLSGGAFFKAARGERTDEGAKLLRYARSNVPFLNMWYTQAAFDHILWNDMQESANPGYLERMQSKAYADRGTEYYWQPTEKLPSEKPDFAKMWQPERGREQVEKVASALPFVSPSE